MMRVLKFLIKFALLGGVLLRGAFGYIDPNTGGLLFQVLAAILTVSSAMILVFPRQIRAGFARVSRGVRGLFNREK